MSFRLSCACASTTIFGSAGRSRAKIHLRSASGRHVLTLPGPAYSSTIFGLWVGTCMSACSCRESFRDSSCSRGKDCGSGKLANNYHFSPLAETLTVSCLVITALRSFPQSKDIPPGRTTSTLTMETTRLRTTMRT